MTAHSVQLTGLDPNTTYYYRVTSTDAAANSHRPRRRPRPLRAASPRPSAALTDTTVADFGAGTTGADTYVSETGDGEVILKPTVGEEFSGAALPAGWSSFIVERRRRPPTCRGGGLHARRRAGRHRRDLYGPGARSSSWPRSAPRRSSTSGFALDFNAAPGRSSAPQHRRAGVRAHELGAAGDHTPIPGSSSARRTATASTGTRVRSGTSSTAPWSPPTPAPCADMRPIVSDFDAGGPAVSVDWMRMSPYSASGTFDVAGPRRRPAGGLGRPVLGGRHPGDPGVALSVRTGEHADAGRSWSAFSPVSTSGGRSAATRATSSTGPPHHRRRGSPGLSEVTAAYTPAPTPRLRRSPAARRRRTRPASPVGTQCHGRRSTSR